jgi:hypothetical protein
MDEGDLLTREMFCLGKSVQLKIIRDEKNRFSPLLAAVAFYELQPTR